MVKRRWARIVVLAFLVGAVAGAALILGPREAAPVVAASLTALVTIIAAVRFEAVSGVLAPARRREVGVPRARVTTDPNTPHDTT